MHVNILKGADIAQATAALSAQYNKNQLVRHARECCGWSGDDARTPKEDIARAIATAYSEGRNAPAASGTVRETEEHVQSQAQDTPPAATVPTVAKAAQTDKAAAAIAAALAGLKFGVDSEEVQATVRAEVAKVADSLRAEVLKQVHRVEVVFPQTQQVRDMGRQHKQFPMLVKALAAGVCVWAAGPAGSGKTTAAEAAAAALGLPFSFDGALDTEYKILGFVDAQGRIVSTAFRKAYTEGGVHLFDECDASLAPATLAINAALANGFAAFPDGMHKRHPNFRCIAAANTWGLGATFDYVGRNKLDAAFLDRFQGKINWEYDEGLERAIAGNPDWVSRVQGLRGKAKAKGLKVVISPRASIEGAKLLAAGFTVAEVEALTIANGMRAEDWAAISR